MVACRKGRISTHFVNRSCILSNHRCPLVDVGSGSTQVDGHLLPWMFDGGGVHCPECLVLRIFVRQTVLTSSHVACNLSEHDGPVIMLRDAGDRLGYVQMSGCRGVVILV